MRIFLKILKWLFVILVAFVAVMFAINWSDQPPSPAALKMQSILDEGSDVPDEENAFVYAMGLAAPEESDPVRAGAECIAKLNASVHKRTINFATDLECDDGISSEYKNDVITKIFDACATANENCDSALQENEMAIAKWLQSDNLLLQRYEGLLQRSKWHLTTEFSVYMPLPYYGVIIGDGQKMFMLKVWHLAGQGNATEVQRLLDLDARYWRMVLSSASTLIDKMIAVAYLEKHFSFSNLALRRLHANSITPLLPDVWLVPLGDELSLKKAMAGELAVLTSIVQETKNHKTFLMDENDVSVPDEGVMLDEWLEYVSGYFLLTQDTQNKHAEILSHLVKIFDVPAKQLPLARQQADVYTEKLAKADNMFLHPYNPIGNVLVAIGAPAYLDYPARIYDLEGVRRAILVVTQLRENGVEVGQIDIALGQSEHRNPYDATPFVWDAKTGSIVFKGLGTKGRNTHSFLY